MLPIWLPLLADAGDLDMPFATAATITELQAMSSATVDRYLAPARRGMRLRGISTTRPSPLLRNSIGLSKASDPPATVPGVIEADTVAHCGPTFAGEFARTLTMTDLVTGWTENASIRNNASRWIVQAVDDLQDLFPFPLRVFDSDNGSEFINHDVADWLQARDIAQTRSRPYRKNDQATVESKNNHASRARTGKSDPIDAEAAARVVLGEDIARLAQPRRPGDRSALRVLLAARSLMDQQRTANRNALTALLRTFNLGIDARKPITDAQIVTVASWRTTRDDGATRIFRAEAKRLAAAVLEQTVLLQQNHRDLATITESLAPGLQSIPGVGPVTGAILVTSYSHHGRVRSEAAFASLGGIAPLPASSGNTTRHRLSRTGDRQLNRAIDVIVRSRLSYDSVTRAYAERRRTEGLSKREIRRCLKRYVCRALYRELRVRMT